MKSLQSRALAECEVASYGGEFTGARAYLVAYRTSRNGQRVMRMHWYTVGASAHIINGSFTNIQTALAQARRDVNARNIQI